jgi:ABC-2 type transport system permease protein
MSSAPHVELPRADARPAARPAAAPGALPMLWRQYRLERRLFWRNPSAAFFNFLLPLLFLALFGAVFSDNQKDLDVIVPGIAGMSVMSTTFSALAFNMTALRELGVLKRVRGTPMPGGVYLGGVAANAVTNTVLQVTIIVVAGKLFFGVDWPRDWGELVVFVVVGVICFASLGVALSHAIPNFDSAPAYVNAVFLPTIFISGVFYDAGKVPAFLRDIAEALPLKHVIDGLSGAMVTGSGLGSNLDALGVLALWAVVGLALAIRGFSWEQRRG